MQKRLRFVFKYLVIIVLKFSDPKPKAHYPHKFCSTFAKFVDWSLNFRAYVAKDLGSKSLILGPIFLS
jgi:hypothetical protein